MTRIDGLSRLYELLYTSGAGSGAAIAKAKGSHRTRATTSRADLDRLVAKRLSGLAPDEQGIRRATKAVVESTLVWQFGEDFVSAGNAASIVDDVSSRLLESTEYKELISDLLVQFSDQSPSAD